MRKTALLIALLAMTALAASAQTTIHIDPDYNGGTQDGSLEHPFQTWREAMPMVPGNTYLQKRGTTCFIDYHMKLVPDVMIGAYGEGARPIIENIVEQEGNFGVFYAYNRDSNDPEYLQEFRNITIRDLEIRGKSISTNILFEGNVEDYTVENCVLRGGVWGIRMLTWGSEEDQEYKHQNRWGRILNNSITGCGEEGIFIGWTYIGVEIGYNTIDDINRKYFGEFGGSAASASDAPGDPIQLTEGAPNLWIHHNYLDKSDTEYKFALILQTSVDGPIPALVEYNIMIGQGTNTASTVYLDGEFEFIFRGNVMSNAPQGIYQKTRNSTLLAYNNVFYNVNFAVTNEGDTGAEFYNNTMIDCGGILQADFNAPLKMQNNLMYTPDTSSPTDWLIRHNLGLLPTGDTFVSDYNLIYPDHPTMWIFNGDSYNSLTDWQAAGYGQNTLVTDPMFVDADNWDFRLQDGSPALDAGIAIPGVTPEGDDNPDMGADMDELYAVGVGQNGSIPLIKAENVHSGDSYGPYTADDNGDFDTGDWMGWLSIMDTEGWLWSYSVQTYIYLTEETLNESENAPGAWVFVNHN